MSLCRKCEPGLSTVYTKQNRGCDAVVTGIRNSLRNLGKLSKLFESSTVFQQLTAASQQVILGHSLF